MLHCPSLMFKEEEFGFQIDREQNGPRNGEYKYKCDAASRKRGLLLEALMGVRVVTQRSGMVTGVPTQKPPLLWLALGPP